MLHKSFATSQFFPSSNTAWHFSHIGIWGVEECVEGRVEGRVRGCIEGRFRGCIEGRVEGRVEDCVEVRVGGLEKHKPIVFEDGLVALSCLNVLGAVGWIR